MDLFAIPSFYYYKYENKHDYLSLNHKSNFLNHKSHWIIPLLKTLNGFPLPVGKRPHSSNAQDVACDLVSPYLSRLISSLCISLNWILCPTPLFAVLSSWLSCFFAWNAFSFQASLKISTQPAKVCAWTMQAQLPCTPKPSTQSVGACKKCRISVPTSGLLSLNLHYNQISRWFLCTFKSGKHCLSTPLHLASLLLH